MSRKWLPREEWKKGGMASRARPSSMVQETPVAPGSETDSRGYPNVEANQIVPLKYVLRCALRLYLHKGEKLLQQCELQDSTPKL